MGEKIFIEDLLRTYKREDLISKNILIVDDDETNLLVLENILEDYKVSKANSASSALQIFQKEDIDLIIADHRMPEITGLEFLKKTIDIKKDVIRIIITAYPAIDLMMDAINRGEVFRFILKPYNPEEIKEAVCEGLERRIVERTIKKLIEELALKNEELENSYRELKSTQESLIHAEKLYVTGSFTSAVIHDLKNVIQDLLFLSEEIITRGEDEITRRAITASLESIQHFERSLKIINKFAKKEDIEIELEETDINSVINYALDIMKMNIDFRKRNVEVKIDEGIPSFKGNKKALGQVLVNLLRNAVDATEEYGKITIKGLKKVDGNITICVEDNGKGIPPQVFEKIWQPGLSFKGEGGTGFGLFISKKIVDSLNGKISCTSEVGKGSEFKIVLPI